MIEEPLTEETLEELKHEDYQQPKKFIGSGEDVCLN
jgi:hypothetical protein